MGGKARVQLTLGWREWIGLPDLLEVPLRAKVDTGARTSALHAEDIRIVRRGGCRYVRFVLRSESGTPRAVVAPLSEKRRVRSSNGLVERRPVIEVRLRVGHKVRRVEVTLTERSLMGFPMLLGRQAIRKLRATVNPRTSFACGQPLAK